MTRKDLEDYRKKELYIKAQVRFLEEAWARATNTSSNLTGMPKAQNHPNDLKEDYMDKKDKIILEKKKQFEIYDKKIREQLDALSEINPLYASILHMIYINGNSIEEVASTMSYSYFRVCHFKGWALNDFDKLDKNFKSANKSKQKQKKM